MSIIFDEIDLKKNFNFVLSAPPKGRDLPPVIRKEVEFDRIDGVFPVQEKYGKRRITIEGIIYGRYYDEVRRNLSNLLRLVSSSRSADKILTFADTDKSIFVRLMTGEAISSKPLQTPFNSKIYEVQLQFEALNPFFFTYSKAYTNIDENIDIDCIQANLCSFSDFELEEIVSGVPFGWRYGPATAKFYKDPGIIGTRSQRISYVNSSENAENMYISQKIKPVFPGEKFFVSCFTKKTDNPFIKVSKKNDGFPPVIEDDISHSSDLGSINCINEWKRIGKIITIPEDVHEIEIFIGMDVAIGESAAINIDAVMVNNLTLMGEAGNLNIEQLLTKIPYTCLEG